MAINRDFRDLLSALSGAETRFLVVGAHAVIYYAAPRYTKDLDVWVEPSPENARRVYRALGEFGAPLEVLAVEDLAIPGTIFQIGIEPNRIDIITEVEGLEFEQAWRNRVESRYGDVSIAVLSLEDLLTNKRKVGRAQDLLDVEWLERAQDRK